MDKCLRSSIVVLILLVIFLFSILVYMVIAKNTTLEDVMKRNFKKYPGKYGNIRNEINGTWKRRHFYADEETLTIDQQAQRLCSSDEDEIEFYISTNTTIVNTTPTILPSIKSDSCPKCRRGVLNVYKPNEGLPTTLHLSPPIGSFQCVKPSRLCITDEEGWYWIPSDNKSLIISPTPYCAHDYCSVFLIIRGLYEPDEVLLTSGIHNFSMSRISIAGRIRESEHSGHLRIQSLSCNGCITNMKRQCPNQFIEEE